MLAVSSTGSCRRHRSWLNLLGSRTRRTGSDSIRPRLYIAESCTTWRIWADYREADKNSGVLFSAPVARKYCRLRSAGRDARAVRRSRRIASCPRASAPRSSRRNTANRPCHRRRPTSAPSPRAGPRRAARSVLAFAGVDGDALRRAAAAIRRPRRVPLRPGIVERAAAARLLRPAAAVGGSGEVRDRSGGSGSLVRAWARSRSLRDVEENIRLRFGLASGGGGSACGGSGSGDRAAPPRPARAAARLGGCRRRFDGGRAPARRMARPRRSRRRRVADRATAAAELRPHSGFGAPRHRPAPSRRAMFFSSRTAIQRPSMITPVQTAITPAMISVLPTLNSLIGMPKPIASRPATTRPIPATNITTHHQTNPCSRARNARKPPTPRYRHIACIANRQLCTGFRHSNRCVARKSNGVRGRVLIDSGAVQPALPYFYRLPIDASLLHCIREITPQLPITWKRNCAIWMPGNEAQSANAEP